MAVESSTISKRIVLSRRFSFSASEERNQAEARTMTDSFERSLSPKFILSKKVSIPSLPKPFKPISLKIEKKALPPYVFPKQIVEKTLGEQIKNLNLFRKAPKSKDSESSGTTKPECISYISKVKKQGQFEPDFKSQDSKSTQGVAISLNRKTVDSEGDSISQSSGLKSEGAGCKKVIQETEASNSSSTYMSKLDDSRQLDTPITFQSKAFKPILKKGIFVRTNSARRREDTDSCHKRKVSFSKFKELRLYSPQL